MGKEPADPGSYAGHERRKYARRTGRDRRTMLRWEPGKEDRRQGTGRREDDQLWDIIRNKH